MGLSTVLFYCVVYVLLMAVRIIAVLTGEGENVLKRILLSFINFKNKFNSKVKLVTPIQL